MFRGQRVAVHAVHPEIAIIIDGAYLKRPDSRSFADGKRMGLCLGDLIGCQCRRPG